MMKNTKGITAVISSFLLIFAMFLLIKNNNFSFISKLLNQEAMQMFVNIIAIISGISGVVIGISGCKAAHLDAVKEFFQQGDAEEFIKARRVLYEKEEKNEKVESDSSDAARITDFYQFWGLMVRKGYLPIWVFEGASGVAMNRLYNILQGYIEEHRKTNKFYAANFEWLVTKSKLKYGKTWKESKNN